MADPQELELKVTLSDEASAKLNNLRAQLSGLSGNNSATGLATRGIKDLSAELSGLASKAGFIGGVVGGITSELAKMGIELIGRATDVNNMALEMTNLSTSASRMGTNSASASCATSSPRGSSKTTPRCRPAMIASPTRCPAC
jgi:hypothetical protein